MDRVRLGADEPAVEVELSSLMRGPLTQAFSRLSTDAPSSRFGCAALQGLLAEVAVPDQVPVNARYCDSRRYARHRLLLTEAAEVLMLFWLPGQSTPIHDHGSSACAVRVVKGCATEIRFERSALGCLVPACAEHFAEGSIFSSLGPDLHQVGNYGRGSQALVTLHVYSPPLTDMRYYSLQSTSFADYERTYHVVAGAAAAQAAGAA